MNLFILDTDPARAAQYHCDKHVLKMILETAQLLCTAHHVTGTDPDVIPYRKTHANHPCAKWVREGLENYWWAVRLGSALCEGYTRRYGKTHKTQAVIAWCRDHLPDIPEGSTPHVQCMPEEYQGDNVVRAYRRYYRGKKADIATWKNGAPDWWHLT